jgi:hypothetical protein
MVYGIDGGSVSLTLLVFFPYQYHSTITPRSFINPLTPNDPYIGRTASLTSKVAFGIFIQQI